MLSMVDQEKDEWVTPAEVAGRMLELVGNDAYVGGTVLEVGLGFVREVGMLGDPGPSGRGIMVSKPMNYVNSVFEMVGREGWGQ